MTSFDKNKSVYFLNNNVDLILKKYDVQIMKKYGYFVCVIIRFEIKYNVQKIRKITKTIFVI